MEFSFYTAGEICFGAGGLSTLGERARPLGKRALVVLGKSSMGRSGSAGRAEFSLREAGVEVVFLEGLDHEPAPEDADEGARKSKDEGCDLVVALGGGSVLDLGKAISGLATNGGQARDYLEGVGDRVIGEPALPLIAIPTTAGTGSEVTKNAVLTSPEEGFKKSMRSPFLIPRVALVDPDLTCSMPPAVTAASGMDALVQLIEAHVSRKATPMSRAMALAGLPLAARSLEVAYKEPQNRKAREEMALASLLSGVALANGGLGGAHGVAAALGALHGVPHGVACAMLIAPVMEMNMAVALEPYAEVGRALTGERELPEAEAATRALDLVRRLTEDLVISPSLRAFGVREEDHPAIARASMGSSMSGNPVDLPEEALLHILASVA